MKDKPKKESAASIEIKRQLSWHSKIFDQLDYSTKIPGADSNIDDEPEWVWNLLAELGQQGLPSFRVRKPGDLSPRDVGLYLGQQCANLYALGDMLGDPTEKQMEMGARVLKTLEDNQKVAGVGSLLKVLDSLGNNLVEMETIFPKFERTLQDAFKAALAQPNYMEAAGFFQGFARGLSKQGLSKAGLAGRTTATQIYQKLHIHRREVEKLPNYPALRQFLIGNGIKESLIGDVKRLQKLCERLKLRLGPRGRPRKQE